MWGTRDYESNLLLPSPPCPGGLPGWAAARGDGPGIEGTDGLVPGEGKGAVPTRRTGSGVEPVYDPCNRGYRSLPAGVRPAGDPPC